jgi:hypothetical protein
MGAAGYDTPIGQLLSGRWGEDVNVQERGGTGGTGTMVGGQQATVIDGLTYLPIDKDSCAIDKILRASYPNGALTDIPLDVGDDERGIRSAVWEAQRTVMTIEAGAAFQMALTALLTTGKHTRTGGGLDHSSCPKTTFEWHRGHVKIASSNAGLRRCAWTVDNRIVPFWSLNEVASGSERFPEYGVKGNEMATLDIVALVETAADLTADELITVATVIGTAVNAADTPETITITSTTPEVYAWDTGPTAHDALKEINYRMGHDANSGNLAISTA